MQNKSRCRLGHAVGIGADVLRNLDKLNGHSLVYGGFSYKPERQVSRPEETIEREWRSGSRRLRSKSCLKQEEERVRAGTAAYTMDSYARGLRDARPQKTRYKPEGGEEEPKRRKTRRNTDEGVFV